MNFFRDKFFNTWILYEQFAKIWLVHVIFILNLHNAEKAYSVATDPPWPARIEVKEGQVDRPMATLLFQGLDIRIQFGQSISPFSQMNISTNTYRSSTGPSTIYTLAVQDPFLILFTSHAHSIWTKRSMDN